MDPRRYGPVGGKDHRRPVAHPESEPESGRRSPGWLPIARDRVATYRVRTGGHLSRENAWLPMREIRGYLYGEN